MNRFKVLIVEDEVRNQKLLLQMLEKSFTHCHTVGIADKVDVAVEKIIETQPDLLLLDIQLKDGTGFDVLDLIPEKDRPKIIFTTAYDQYAIKAFKYSAVNYLLKPIDRNELKESIEKSLTASRAEQLEKIQVLMDRMVSKVEDQMLKVSGLQTTEFVRINDIVHIEAMGAYSKLFLNDNTTHVVSKVIKHYEELLQSHQFFRIHQSHIVNLRFVKSFNKSDQTVLLSNGKELGLSRKRREDFLRVMEEVIL